MPETTKALKRSLAACVGESGPPEVGFVSRFVSRKDAGGDGPDYVCAQEDGGNRKAFAGSGMCISIRSVRTASKRTVKEAEGLRVANFEVRLRALGRSRKHQNPMVVYLGVSRTTRRKSQSRLCIA
jgi:hypothetical protein